MESWYTGWGLHIQMWSWHFLWFFFWGVILAVVGYAVYRKLRDHPPEQSPLKFFRFWKRDPFEGNL